MRRRRGAIRSEHGADLHLLHARALNRRRNVFVDGLVDFDDHVAVVVLDALERDAADDAIAERLDDFAGFNDRSDIDAFERAGNRSR